MRPVLCSLLLCLTASTATSQQFPRVAGAWKPLGTAPGVFDTQADLNRIAAETQKPNSFTAKMWSKLGRQEKADLASDTDWDATYSGCNINIYLRAFSFESSGGYSNELESDAQISQAMHVKAGMKAPRGAAVVASRLALYAALLHAGAEAPAGSPTANEAAALSRRILLAWANHGFRAPGGGFKTKPPEFCGDTPKDSDAVLGVGLQVGRGAIYSVHAQDLLEGIKAIDGPEIHALNGFHEALWTIIRYNSNYNDEPEFTQHGRMCEIYSNHHAMHMLSMLAIARLVDSENWFEQTLYGNLPKVPPVTIAWADYFDHAFYGEHDKPVSCYPNTGKDRPSSRPSFQTKDVVPGEIEDRYRNANNQQGIGYPMFTLEDEYFQSILLHNAGFDQFNYRGRHGQDIQHATDYYACFAKNAGFDKAITAENSRECPNVVQYVGQSVNSVETQVLMGAREFPHDELLHSLVADAETRPDGQTLDPIVFGHWPE